MKIFGFFMRRADQYIFLLAKNKPTAEEKARNVVKEYCAVFSQTYDNILDAPQVNFWSRTEFESDKRKAQEYVQECKRDLQQCDDAHLLKIRQENLQRWRWSLALAENPIA